jgi:hypothetical protein
VISVVLSQPSEKKDFILKGYEEVYNRLSAHLDFFFPELPRGGKSLSVVLGR